MKSKNLKEILITFSFAFLLPIIGFGQLQERTEQEKSERLEQIKNSLTETKQIDVNSIESVNLKNKFPEIKNNLKSKSLEFTPPKVTKRDRSNRDLKIQPKKGIDKIIK